MKKEANYNKDKEKRKSTGLPMDDLLKFIEEQQKKALQEIAEAREKAKRKKGK